MLGYKYIHFNIPIRTPNLVGGYLAWASQPNVFDMLTGFFFFMKAVHDLAGDSLIRTSSGQFTQSV